MAKSKGTAKQKMLTMLGLPLAFWAYQTATPFFEETKKMQAESKKLSEAVRQVKSDSITFSSDWESQMKLKEEQITAVLPNTIIPSEILRYFATGFEKNHPGVEFTSLVPQPPVQSSMIADKENPSSKVQISKLQIKAKMPSQYLFSYLDHVESYKGLLRIQEVSFSSISEAGKKDLLALDMSLELFVSPKDWIPKRLAKPNENSDRSVAAAPDEQSHNWFSTDSLSEKPGDVSRKNDDVDSTPEKKPRRTTPPHILVRQFVGTSIVIGDDLFEEGDHVDGWLISKIDRKSKILLLKKNGVSFKVVVP